MHEYLGKYVRVTQRMFDSETMKPVTFVREGVVVEDPSDIGLFYLDSYPHNYLEFSEWEDIEILGGVMYEWERDLDKV